MRLLAAAVIAWPAAASHACAQTAATPWKIISERDQMTDQTLRLALTTPKTNPVQQGKSITTALMIKCATTFIGGTTHPELMVLFASLGGMWHVRAMHTRYRFDDGPVRDYKLKVVRRAGGHGLFLPKLGDQDPAAEITAATRLRVEVNLPYAGATLLDFNVAGASDAIRQIACR